MIIYLVFMYFVSLVLGYILAFTNTTLIIGKSLSDTDTNTGTGYQDAITPPLFSKSAILVYIISIVGLIFGFWRFGLFRGFGIIIGFFFVVALNKVLILPKSGSEHFRNIIIRSMIKRHADYLRDNDTIRASAMSYLLDKLGIPIKDLIKNDDI